MGPKFQAKSGLQGALAMGEDGAELRTGIAWFYFAALAKS